MLRSPYDSFETAAGSGGEFFDSTVKTILNKEIYIMGKRIQAEHGVIYSRGNDTLFGYFGWPKSVSLPRE